MSDESTTRNSQRALPARGSAFERWSAFDQAAMVYEAHSGRVNSGVAI